MSGRSKGAVCQHGLPRTENWKADVDKKRDASKAAKKARKKNRKAGK